MRAGEKTRREDLIMKVKQYLPKFDQIDTSPYKEIIEYMPSSTKASLGIGLVNIVFANAMLRNMRKAGYTWKQVYFSPTAWIEHMRAHPVAYTALLVLTTAQVALDQKSRKDLLRINVETAEETAKIYAQLAAELKVVADEYGFELDMDNLDLEITEDDSIDGFEINTEAVNYDDRYVRVLVAPCGHIAGMDVSDDVPGFCRTKEEAQEDLANGFSVMTTRLDTAKTFEFDSCTHNPKWGVVGYDDKILDRGVVDSV